MGKDLAGKFKQTKWESKYLCQNKVEFKTKIITWVAFPNDKGWQSSGYESHISNNTALKFIKQKI